jgi:hypothetical protein
MSHHMKTWLPTLAKVLQKVCGYINRWRPQIERHLPEENWPLLDAVLVACTALDQVVEDLIPD